MPEVPDDLTLRAFSAWTALYGWVSFELFGQLEKTIFNRRTAFERSIRIMGATVGLR
jgi:hypothetical protein